MRMFVLLFLFTPISILGMMRVPTKALASASRRGGSSFWVPIAKPVSEMTRKEREHHQAMLDIMKAAERSLERAFEERNNTSTPP